MYQVKLERTSLLSHSVYIRLTVSGSLLDVDDFVFVFKTKKSLLPLRMSYSQRSKHAKKIDSQEECYEVNPITSECTLLMDGVVPILSIAPEGAKFIPVLDKNIEFCPIKRMGLNEAGVSTDSYSYIMGIIHDILESKVRYEDIGLNYVYSWSLLRADDSQRDEHGVASCNNEFNIRNICFHSYDFIKKLAYASSIDCFHSVIEKFYPGISRRITDEYFATLRGTDEEFADFYNGLRIEKLKILIAQWKIFAFKKLESPELMPGMLPYNVEKPVRPFETQREFDSLDDQARSALKIYGLLQKLLNALESGSSIRIFLNKMKTDTSKTFKKDVQFLKQTFAFFEDGLRKNIEIGTGDCLVNIG